MTQTTLFPTHTRRSDDTLHPVLQNVEAHWRDMRGTQMVPARNDIDPNMLDDALPWTFVLQRVAPGVARVRVAGQKLHDILRMDPRGMPLSAFFGPDDRSTLSVYLESVFADPAVIAIPLTVPATFLRKAVQGQILMMPLCDAHGEVTRVIGAMVTDGPLGPRHRRLCIDDTKPIRHDVLQTMRMVPSKGPQRSQTKKPDTLLRPALTLVVNNG
jgi:hypothetical protein